MKVASLKRLPASLPEANSGAFYPVHNLSGTNAFVSVGSAQIFGVSRAGGYVSVMIARFSMAVAKFVMNFIGPSGKILILTRKPMSAE